MCTHPLGHELRAFRIRAGLTLQQVASVVGCTSPYLCRIETGHSSPTNKIFLKKLAEAIFLTEIEYDQLIKAANESQKTIRIPSDASLLGYRVANNLIRNINDLNIEDLSEIEIILSRNNHN